MTEALGAAKSERTSGRSGYYKRFLMTRVDRIELRIPQDRVGLFSTDLFERYERSEKRPAGFAAANVSALMQMQVSGVSTRKIAKVTEELCGHGFLASTISRISAKLDAELKKFAERALEGPFPYPVLDARYERVREDGAVRDRAILVALGVVGSGGRQVLGVVQVVSDDHSGLKKAIREVLQKAVRRGLPSGAPLDLGFIATKVHETT